MREGVIMVRLKGVRVGTVLTGSHCTVKEVLVEIENLKREGAIITPILSYSVDQTDNRFYRTADLKARLQKLTGGPIINTIVGAEPIGPQKLLDLVIVAPCTGNTIAKLANGITDTPALMAVKAHLRNQRPVVIGVSTNDGLGLNAKNVGILMATKNIYFIPFRQDNPIEKPNSIVADMKLMVETAIAALQGKQLQPVLLGSA
ncbi:MAG TPA: dipicolinate synthase subunit B [Syntrophothermus lipocalidus]|nr:dipicolinate synthase subunit B [Syntrophothermus lipocalidus]